jgi:hypothetical protein
MIRIIIWNLMLFSIPFIVAWGWSLWVARYRPDMQTQMRWALCASLGILLVLASLFVLRLTSGDAPEAVYVSPHVEDGKVVPGHFEPGHSQ